MQDTEFGSHSFAHEVGEWTAVPDVPGVPLLI